ncbi:MAG TPA: 30S ribosomal protein S16 [Patescibacteria group bacterium]|nr:30S ribosomal protein S16 [Patescibacteria group bacterium]
MLVIRMQRTGRKGHAQFRVVVQDSRRTPTSGKIVAHLGHFNPHTKETTLDKTKAQFYLEHGAQPSDRAARLLKAEGVKLPKWVELPDKKKSSIRNPEKLRRNRPPEPKAPKAPVEEAPAEVTPAEAAPAAEADETAETPVEPTEGETTEPAVEGTAAPVEASAEATAETPAEDEKEVPAPEAETKEAPVKKQQEDKA